ncbi:serine hydrolase domain-containing protein [Aurantiacibacter sediminis]|uniref:Serine hydrolase n=1 Tax=Aurantiacibacter sediminis TaxID=2793064 RepID=A0ABS0N2L9_9SPHN|nr:serine hydrolase [Aurantiacibacter sediminis]MBH5322216.1 serine hydrolase [Aurantiacibacter sediminis]
MIRTIILTAAALSLAVPASAQSISQSELEERYDRALAAGYVALFTCGAIANAERSGQMRSLESVREWELTGIYPRIADIAADMEPRLLRDADGRLALVEVDWADDMAARFAEVRGDEGCALAPIGLSPSMPETVAVSAEATETVSGWVAPMIGPATASRPLDEELEAAFDGTYGEDARTTAVIVRGSVLQRVRYAPGFNANTPQRTWSVAKSIAATFVGAAVHRGEADVEAPLVYDDWRWDERRVITIDDLLRMASGRYSDTPGNRTDPLYMGGSGVEETASNWPLLHEPGAVFRYANNDTLMAVKAIEDSFDTVDAADFLEQIGMDDTVAETDWAGDYILSSQVWATAPDLVTLGQLHLDDGVLPDGTRVLPEGWVDYISNPAGPQPGGSRNWGYGAGWWLLNQSEGIPADTFMAAGNRGQYIVVVPSRDIVIVRRGEDPAGGSGFDIESFTRDVLAALRQRR